MNNVIKKFQLGFVSLSALAVLAACGDGGTTEEDPATTDDAVEETAPAEETTPGEDTAGEGATDDAAEGDTAQDDTSEAEDPASQDPDTVDTSNGISDVQFPIAFEQAIQIFEDTFGEGVYIDEIEFDEEDGAYEYHISGWDDVNEYDLEIDAETGEIVEQEREAEPEDDNHTIDIASIIAPQEAMNIAAEATGTDFIESWTLEEENDKTVYEIDTEGADDDDITIDAQTGDVVEN